MNARLSAIHSRLPQCHLFAANNVAYPDDISTWSVVPLEAPMSTDWHLDSLFEERREKLLSKRLHVMPAHCSLFLLGNVLTEPNRLMHRLRPTLCIDSPVLPLYNAVHRDSLSATLNCDLNASDRAKHLCPFDSSRKHHRTHFHPTSCSASNHQRQRHRCCSSRLGQTGIQINPGFYNVSCSVSSGVISTPSMGWTMFDKLLNATSGPVGRARLSASCSPGSADWLHALPHWSVGLKLDNELRLRLMAIMVSVVLNVAQGKSKSTTRYVVHTSALQPWPPCSVRLPANGPTAWRLYHGDEVDAEPGLGRHMLRHVRIESLVCMQPWGSHVAAATADVNINSEVQRHHLTRWLWAGGKMSRCQATGDGKPLTSSMKLVVESRQWGIRRVRRPSSAIASRRCSVVTRFLFSRHSSQTATFSANNEHFDSLQTDFDCKLRRVLSPITVNNNIKALETEVMWCATSRRQHTLPASALLVWLID